MKFRNLKANEINVRVQSCSFYEESKKCCAVFLLYKDARCDMNILDESVGCENWQRNHEVIDGNLYCNVGINFKTADGYDRWVWKQDVGSESNMEVEKGTSSDSFKRACFNWGIGRELYTSPSIKIWLNQDDYFLKNGKAIPTISLEVAMINYDENKNIVRLILNDKNGVTRFDYDKSKEEKGKTIPKPKANDLEIYKSQYKEIKQELIDNGIDFESDKVKEWLLKNADVKTLDIEKLTCDDLRKVNSAMIHLLQQKKMKGK